MTGTSSVMLIGLNKPLTTIRLSHLTGIDDNTHYLYGAMSSTGGSLKWFRMRYMAEKPVRERLMPIWMPRLSGIAPEPPNCCFCRT